MQGGWQEDSEAQHPKTDAHQAAQHHSLSSVTVNGPAVLDMVQTVQAEANEVDGGKDVWGYG